LPRDPVAQRELDAVAPELYRELKRLAAGAMAGERRHHTLQPTALVHEAYLRLAGGKAPIRRRSGSWRDTLPKRPPRT
jgi:hypothetical protein